MSANTLVIGSQERDFLHLRAVRRIDSRSQDFFDGNWIEAVAEVKSGTFSASANITLRAEAFVQFRDQLAILIEQGKGVAKFVPMEPWLTIGIQRDCFETVETVCSLRDNLEGGNELRARFRVDAKLLPAILAELDRIIEAFPVVGNA